MHLGIYFDIFGPGTLNIQGQQRNHHSNLRRWYWDGATTRGVWDRTIDAIFFPNGVVPALQRRRFYCNIDSWGLPILAKRDWKPSGYDGGDPSVVNPSSCVVSPFHFL